MNTPTTHILGIVGSLRRNSYNRAALRAAVQLSPPGVTIEAFEVGDLPLFNQDQESKPPITVIDFKRKIRSADAILFVTPEYNHSIPGVLKNAIDWASRPGGDSAWSGKPAAIMGATPGNLGTVHAQSHLRQVLMSLDVKTMNQPEVLISNAAERFDDNGTLTHEATKRLIQLFMENLVRWTHLIAPPVSAAQPERELQLQ